MFETSLIKKKIPKKLLQKISDIAKKSRYGIFESLFLFFEFFVPWFFSSLSKRNNILAKNCFDGAAGNSLIVCY